MMTKTKKDINFLKYIKPKLKDKEVLDKKRSHLKRYDKAIEHVLGSRPESVEFIDTCILPEHFPLGYGNLLKEKKERLL